MTHRNHDTREVRVGRQGCQRFAKMHTSPFVADSLFETYFGFIFSKYFFPKIAFSFILAYALLLCPNVQAGETCSPTNLKARSTLKQYKKQDIPRDLIFFMNKLCGSEGTERLAPFSAWESANFVPGIDLNDDGFKEFLCPCDQPAHGPDRIFVITYVGESWQKLTEFYNFGEWNTKNEPISVLQTKTGNYYNICQNGEVLKMMVVASKSQITPPFQVGGLKINDKVSGAIEKFGEPTQKTKPVVSGFEVDGPDEWILSTWDWQKNGLSLDVMFDPKNPSAPGLIKAIRAIAPFAGEIGGGLKIGSSESTLLQVFGKPDSQYGNKMTYGDGEWLTITIKNDKIDSFELSAPY